MGTVATLWQRCFVTNKWTQHFATVCNAIQPDWAQPSSYLWDLRGRSLMQCMCPNVWILASPLSERGINQGVAILLDTGVLGGIESSAKDTCHSKSLDGHQNRGCQREAAIISTFTSQKDEIDYEGAPLAAAIGFFVSAACRGSASERGVCPPNCTMMPSGRSVSITLSTSSTVRGSK